MLTDQQLYFKSWYEENKKYRDMYERNHRHGIKTVGLKEIRQAELEHAKMLDEIEEAERIFFMVNRFALPKSGRFTD